MRVLWHQCVHVNELLTGDFDCRVRKPDGSVVKLFLQLRASYQLQTIIVSRCCLPALVSTVADSRRVRHGNH